MTRREAYFLANLFDHFQSIHLPLQFLFISSLARIKIGSFSSCDTINCPNCKKSVRFGMSFGALGKRY